MEGQNGGTSVTMYLLLAGGVLALVAVIVTIRQILLQLCLKGLVSEALPKMVISSIRVIITNSDGKIYEGDGKFFLSEMKRRNFEDHYQVLVTAWGGSCHSIGRLGQKPKWKTDNYLVDDNGDVYAAIRENGARSSEKFRGPEAKVTEQIAQVIATK